MDRIRVAVLGASGYTGADAVRLLLTHPQVTIVALAAQQKAGQAMSEAWPHFMGAGGLPRLVAPEDVPFDRVDVVLGCLPHGASAAVLAGLEAVRILDLSADFRLKDAATYRAWYGLDHPAPHLLAEAVYGLSEYAREHLPAARLVACPGCYPTAVLLALLPLARAGLIAPEGIAVFAISGVSGAGRALKESYLFCEVGEAAAPYGVGHHRHMPEIEQELGAAFGQEVRVGFTPHLVPMNRGELITASVALAPGASVADLRAALDERYATEPFVHLLGPGVAPATRMVRGSNLCVLNVFPDRLPGRAIVAAAIDNLVKGSAGQAVQNLNLMFGLPETLGLEAPPLFP
ncbi:MAG: N-acetyl-gamma-glutamyl-phosphate reductase [Sphingomonadaceae bacterium]|uniref:N-acetyl-gamma-glutamyl-phosphate reductase n=1 Tax=Thermaurantiacus sp. TaxID=2820283 RepID=UPI00298F3260|nr:N-acetyl-gamma-glutamyl-phosphate reductase [Thermaurantiacus sp.]MCS6987218.1 N-acetyl-gamma-glutamyl-phosphate reductase [Sphingomonadaceae bacterium]MDW8414438.1 N-acetyl-gamma-glutamyl-phosphate reductase [Thermaurantiacus sp.]